MNLYQYKILFAPFPFGDLRARKFRPVLGLTEPIGFYREVVLAYITTNIDQNVLSTDLLIQVAKGKRDINGLKKTSLIKLHKLFSLPESLILGQLGVLSDKQQILVKRKMKNLFAC